MEINTGNNRFELKGVGISSGIGFGTARVMAKAPIQLPQYEISETQVPLEIKRFIKARTKVNQEINKLGKRAPKNAPKEISSFLEMYRLLLNDTTLEENVLNLVKTEHINVEWALAKHLEGIKKVFENLSDSYLAERGDDIEHVVRRLQTELMGKRTAIQEEIKADEGEVILVTSDLSLTDVIWLTEYEDLDVVGIVTEKGGATSHTAVLSQTLFIPAIVGVSGARDQIKSGNKVFIDSEKGILVCNPTEEECKEIQERVEEQEKRQSRYYRARRRVAETTDKYRLQLLANVAMCSGVEEILHQGAQGIGLFRSEYLFLGRNELPDEQEQYENYSSLIDVMGEKPITIRTLDVGGDKILNQEARLNNSAIKGLAEKEDNPALGLRAIRFSLASPDLFLTQIRAILRASTRGKIKIMLPLISNLNEIRTAKKYIETAKSQLRAKNIPFNEEIPLGIMIEVPAVAYRPGDFLKEVDFASIGTNDLIQYTLAVDRGNVAVAPLYDSYHPAILHLINNVAKSSKKLGVPVSICGEMGGDPELAPLFIGMGIKNLSMSAMQIPMVKEVIRSVSYTECERLTERVLKLSESEQIRQSMKKFHQLRLRKMEDAK